MKKIMFLALCLILPVMLFAAGGQEEAPAASGAEENAMPYKGQTLTVSMWGYNMDKIEANVSSSLSKRSTAWISSLKPETTPTVSPR